MKTKKYQASVLVVTLLILVIVLVSALSLSTVVIKQRQSSLESGKSNLAFQNADTGVELVMEDIETKSSGYVKDLAGYICGEGKVVDATRGFSVEIKREDGTLIKDCDGTTEMNEIRVIKSIGFGASKESRAIEASISQKNTLPPRSDVMIALDYSGSMSAADAELEKIAVKKMIDNLSAEYQLGMVIFNLDVVQHPLTLLNSSAKRDELKKWLDDNFKNSSGGTNFGKAINSATTELEGANGRSGYSKAILLITDGIPNVPAYGDPPVPAIYDPTIKCSGSAVWDSSELVHNGFWNKTASGKAKDAADAAKAKEIYNFTVGIDFVRLEADCKTKAENLMEYMASPIDGTHAHFYPIEDFDKLQDVLDTLSGF